VAVIGVVSYFGYMEATSVSVQPPEPAPSSPPATEPPSVEPPLAPTEEPVTSEPNPDEKSEPTPPQKIEVEWKTNYPYGSCEIFKYGVGGVFIDSEDGKTAHAIGFYSVSSVQLLTTKNGGQSWEREIIDVKQLSQKELETIQNPTRYHGSVYRQWEGWQNLQASFPLDPQLNTLIPGRSLFQAIDPNSNNQLVAITEGPFDYPPPPEGHQGRNYESLVPLFHNNTISRLFLSLNGGKSWQELTAPPPFLFPETLEENLEVGGIAIVSFNGLMKIYVGLDQGKASTIWQTTFPISLVSN